MPGETVNDSCHIFPHFTFFFNMSIISLGENACIVYSKLPFRSKCVNNARLCRKLVK